jgi:EAL domain-containing protein (putative c-di-GMP-specific phosphodiesterase class I)
MGVEISEFGKNSFKISAIPSFIADMNIKKFFDMILSEIESLKNMEVEDLLFDKLAQKACKAAIKSGDIRVWYQPQVDYGKGQIIGAEALCRWDHTKLGWLYPFDFISTLEEAGLIFDLDRFVWETVCKDLHRWNESGIRRSVSVNVSRDDIRGDYDIADHFHRLIQTYDLTPDQLHIEITETAYVENSETLIRATERLRSMGFQVEMDDFGSGYSSLHMLKEVPVDRIKLDLHFLTSSGDSEKSQTIVSCMIQMVHLLGMKMIAEGVETAEQAEFLKEKGCSEMQGYYFYKPMEVEEFEKLSEKEESL